MQTEMLQKLDTCTSVNADHSCSTGVGIGQTTACRSHAAREGILCSPQGSHTYIEGTYFKSTLK